MDSEDFYVELTGNLRVYHPKKRETAETEESADTE